jgi:hypothetical protein
VPRYTYSFDDRRVKSQPHELVLADADSARYAAKSVARVLAAREMEAGKLDLSQQLSIKDESGRTIYTLRLKDAVQISGV